jgi:hypothetical protein
VLALAHLDVELALAEADPVELRPDGLGERLGRGAPCRAEVFRDFVDARLSLLDRGRGLSGGIGAGLPRVQLRSRLGSAREQLLVRIATEAAFGRGNPVQLTLDVLDPARLGFQAGEEGAQLRRGLS